MQILLAKLEDYFPEDKDEFDLDTDILMVKIEPSNTYRPVDSTDDLNKKIFDIAAQAGSNANIHVYIARYYVFLTTLPARI